MKTSIFIMFTTLFLLISCDSGPNFAQLCEENPKICNEFHEDSWCKRERIGVGAANIAHKQTPEDLQKFNQLVAYEKYNKCVSHASKIEHIKLKEKKTLRIENMMKARGRIEEISNQTSKSNHPRLLYFHWTRYLNEESLEKFLALEGTSELETPESQYELATYYAKRDQDKTLQLLFHSLELYQDGNIINNEIFKSLSSIFADKNEIKQSYIWLKILTMYDPEDPDINEGTLPNYISTYKLDAKFLDQVAETTLDKILNSSFVPPKY
ncbi:MAG: DUF2989 domain-containing protein [Colwelliaceae bacterium]|nr:DUF2989 domain-containing protein [Colwelliaceae bacterium]